MIALSDPLIVSHEMFHWWNGRTIQLTKDANWIEEGFTGYYASKALVRSGFWTAADQGKYIQGLRANLGGDPSPGKYDFLQVSQRLKTEHYAEDYSVVYDGGALLAYWLDARLHDQGQSLEGIWSLLSKSPTLVGTQTFLQVLGQLGGADLAGDFELYLHVR